MSSPQVSAIVLNYRTPQHTVRCVQALLGQAMSSELWAMSTKEIPSAHSSQLKAQSWLEVIVVDNHSTDDSIGVLRNRTKHNPRVRIIEARRNIGFGQGYNLGARHARGKYLLINNPAKLLHRDALDRMTAMMEEDASIGILGPRLVQEDGTTRDSFRAFPSILDVLAKRTPLKHLVPGRMRRYLRTDANPEEPHDTDWVIGGCFLIRRDLWEELGGFDRRFFLFFEDIDLCRRLWEKGKRVIYYPQVQATDRKRRLSEGGIPSLLLHRTGRSHIASAVKYFWKWRGARAPGQRTSDIGQRVH